MSLDRSLFRWFEREVEMLAYAEALHPVLAPIEAHIAARSTHSGFCTCCSAPAEFVVSSGVMLGHGPNLREGLLCAGCGLSNRNRLMFTALRELTTLNPDASVAILERLSPLFVRLQRELPDIRGSEFVSHDRTPGSESEIGGVIVRHESITGLSHASGSLDIVCHNDVLEHVHDTVTALRECRRVLRAGGVLLFTCPFLMYLKDNSTRATQQPDGSVVLHGPPEYHGDPVHPEGALTFHHFGWQLLRQCREAGFADAYCGVLYDPHLGFTSANHPDWRYGNMLPVVFRARA
jgi:SAM-dependent methyltransferase